MLRQALFTIASLSVGSVVPAATDNEYPKTEWHVDESKISCTPKQLRPNDTLTIKMPVPHEQELAIYYEKKRSWWILVFWPEPGSRAKPIMSREEFVHTREIKLKVKEAKSPVWADDARDHVIFAYPGKYSVFLAQNLETEGGGYTCEVEYVPNKK